jgi:hypothetical protein
MPATKLICPECGGTIGERTSPTEVPCTCVAKPTGPTDEELRAAAAAAASAATEDTEKDVAGGAAKVCRVCGASVEGKKRYKDSLGYWCASCHKGDKADRVAGQKRCTDCNRWFPVEKLIESDDERLCYTCNKNRNAKRREILKNAAKGRIHHLYEKKQLLILVGVFAVLLMIIVFQRLGWIGSGQ